LSYIVVAFAVAFVGLTLAGVGFGFVFNFTHSAPFGLYKEIADPSKTPHTPASYAFFCPDVRWPGMKGEPNHRKAHANLSGRIRAPHQACCGMAW
jgi:type IV secretory pathway protease TraF